MGRENYYKPGSFYRIDDRTGFAIRAERQQMEWTGLIVDRRVWEQRQSQDFVKGVADNQTVPYARPRQPNVSVNASEGAQFDVFGDNPLGVSFEVQNGSLDIVRGIPTVTAANYPKSF